jgi:hypothetical protein
VAVSFFLWWRKSEVENESLPNYIEKLSLLKNAKIIRFQQDFWGELPIFHAKNCEKNAGSGTELSHL